MQRSIAEWATATAGARQQGVESVVCLRTSGKGSLGLGFVGQIGRDPDQFGVGPESIGEREAIVLPQRNDEEACPFCGEPQCSGFGEAGRARDPTDLSGDLAGGS